MRPIVQAISAVTVLVLLLGGVTTSSAGLVFELETTYSSGSETRTESSRLYVLEPNMKMEIMGSDSSGDDGSDEMIFRGDKDHFIIVNHHEGSYMVMDRETMGRLAGQVQDSDAEVEKAVKEFEEKMAELPPEQREMMKKMLKDRMPPGTAMGADRPKPEYRRTDESKTLNGYPCVRYDVYVGEEKIQELWVTDWENIKGSSELMNVFEDMSELYMDMVKSMDKIAGGMMGADRNPVENFANVEGFPVVSRHFADGELESETVLKSIHERDLGAGDFSPPEDYKLRKIGTP